MRPNDTHGYPKNPRDTQRYPKIPIKPQDLEDYDCFFGFESLRMALERRILGWSELFFFSLEIAIGFLGGSWVICLFI